MAATPRRRKKKLGIPHIDAVADFSEIFKAETADDGQPLSFSEALAGNLGQELIEAALEQKGEAKNLSSPGGETRDKEKKYPPPQTDLDLHGLTVVEAEMKLDSFFLTARGRGLRSVRIITGKGLHSKGPGVLRDITEIKLAEFKGRGAALNWYWDKTRKEDSGAVIVHIC